MCADLTRDCAFVCIQVIKFVDDISTLYPSTLFYASTIEPVNNAVVPELQSNAGGQVVDALRGLLGPQPTSRGQNSPLALQGLYDAMELTCAANAVTCVGVFISDTGATSRVYPRNSAPVPVIGAFKRDIGPLAYFLLGNLTVSPNDEVRSKVVTTKCMTENCVEILMFVTCSNYARVDTGNSKPAYSAS